MITLRAITAISTMSTENWLAIRKCLSDHFRRVCHFVAVSFSINISHCS